MLRSELTHLLDDIPRGPFGLRRWVATPAAITATLLATTACAAIAAPPAKTERARQQFADRTGAYVVADAETGAIATTQRTDGFLSAPRKGSPTRAALDWLRDHKLEFGLDDQDIAALRLKSARRSAGVTHLEWAQTASGIESFNTALRINVARDGRVINAGGSPVGGLEIESARPAVAAPAADARLVVFADPAGDRLAWRWTAGEHTVVIDAQSGRRLARISQVDSASSASVFENHPGDGTTGTKDVTGYLDASPTSLRGPYAHAYSDVDADDAPDPSEEIAPSAAFDFIYPQILMGPGTGQYCPSAVTGVANSCTWSGPIDADSTDNREQRTTQLFYFVNRFHDWLAQPEVGFSGFEGSDRVIARNDFGDGECGFLGNASMQTGPEGQSPVMRMFLFGARNCPDPIDDVADPAVSSADDMSVVAHEYTHGLSNRLIGGGAGLESNQAGAMGEGWSDWYALDYLVANGYETDTSTTGQLAVGKYVTNNTVRGIRSDPMDCPVGSTTSRCNGSATAPGGGYTFADLGKVSSSAASVHANGEIWAQTLWDLRGALGPSVARKRITDAMRLTTTIEPGFLDMRNAIVAADLTAGGAQLSAIWAVFAARGMGCSASSPSSESLSVTPAFDLPAPGQTCVPSSNAIAAKVAPPAVNIGPLRSTVRLDRRGRFKLRFTATPQGSAGRLVIRSSRKVKVSGRKRTLLFASRSFGVGPSGLVDLQLTVPKSVLKAVKKLKKVRATASFSIAGQSFSRGITIKRP